MLVKMIRSIMLAAFMLSAVAQPADGLAVLSVCELSHHYAKFRDEVVAVRGVFYYGLREDCHKSCGAGVWPSFIDLVGGRDGVWNELGKTLDSVEAEAKATGKRYEIWVTVVGRLRTRVKWSPRGSCGWESFGPGYGHLDAFPAQIIAERIRDIEVRVNPKSPYDYAHLYHGPL
jgi:hypothetical protein